MYQNVSQDQLCLSHKRSHQLISPKTKIKKETITRRTLYYMYILCVSFIQLLSFTLQAHNNCPHSFIPQHRAYVSSLHVGVINTET